MTIYDYYYNNFFYYYDDRSDARTTREQTTLARAGALITPVPVLRIDMHE